MKILLSIVCTFLFACVVSSSVIVGREKCTYGPTYWCSNLINAKSCGAVKHCIKTVWEKQHVPEDTDSICKICLDMVAQARDQLESNETQEELKEVFEGTCDLMPINVVRKECRRLADDFIPELVEALASQMNPQVVCSTAGLCNNAKIDALLKDHESQKKKNLLSCNQCNKIGQLMTQKFQTSSRDQVLNGFLSACGQFSSFSDACSSIVLTHFNEIYEELSRNFNADNICHMSGVCASKYHNHAQVEVEEVTDDIPCALCEQLIKHFRDVLVANTTESEFKTVLQGLCSQTKQFKSECLDLVNQYYSVIYETLVNNLDANGACFLIGVCPKGQNLQVAAPHMPLLPSNQKNLRRLGENEKLYTDEEIKTMILPIDQLMTSNTNLTSVDNNEICTICQYFLHFIQEELSDIHNEEQIKNIVGRTCDKFSLTIRSNCHQFIDLYGDAIIALLVQSIDPRDICPNLKLCPRFVKQEVKITRDQCPLCVLVVKQAQDYIKSEKTIEVVKKALDRECSRLPAKLQLQCTDFVNTYYDELLKKLLADFTPHDICMDLKLCERSEDEKLKPQLNTNKISDYTVNGQYLTTSDSGECYLCTTVLSNAENKITNGMNKNQIKDILLRECSVYYLYESVCDEFVKRNIDQIYDLVEQKLTPKEVCQHLSLCVSTDDVIIVNIMAIPAKPAEKKNQIAPHEPPHFQDDAICVLCEFVMAKLEAELRDKKTQAEIKEAIENICTKMPRTISKECTKFVDQYSDLIIALIDTVPPKEICREMSLCSAQKKQMHLVGDNECTYGPTHFCSDMEIAEKCKATKYCKEKKLGKFAA